MKAAGDLTQRDTRRLVEETSLYWKKRKKNGGDEWWPYVKTYLEGRTKRSSPPLGHDLEGSKKASIDLRDLLGKKVFDNPKPVGLIKRLIEIAPNVQPNALILDFFAGSGTTGQAVLELNALDGGNRRFILVQLPENTECRRKTAVGLRLRFKGRIQDNCRHNERPCAPLHSTK